MDFDFDEMAYPDVFLFNGTEYKGSRSSSKKEIDLPFTDEPDINLGDVIIQKVGRREFEFRVLDVAILRNGTLLVGTAHPHLLTLKIENLSENEHKTHKENPAYYIGSITGTQVQVGNNNSQIANISVQELMEKIASSQDAEAKSLLKRLLENSTVASIVGAGASAIFGLF